MHKYRSRPIKITASYDFPPTNCLQLDAHNVRNFLLNRPLSTLMRLCSLIFSSGLIETATHARITRTPHTFHASIRWNVFPRKVITSFHSNNFENFHQTICFVESNKENNSTRNNYEVRCTTMESFRNRSDWTQNRGKLVGAAYKYAQFVRNIYRSCCDNRI